LLIYREIYLNEKAGELEIAAIGEAQDELLYELQDLELSEDSDGKLNY
jgi:hypothetical protein